MNQEEHNLLQEMIDANANMEAATRAFTKAAAKMERLNKQFIKLRLYFRIAVGVGLAAIVLAAVAFNSGYHDRQDLRKIQSEQAYTSCEDLNDAKQSTLDILRDINTIIVSDPAFNDRIELFIETYKRGNGGFKDCTIYLR